MRLHKMRPPAAASAATAALLFSCCCSTAWAFLPWTVMPARGAWMAARAHEGVGRSGGMAVMQAGSSSNSGGAGNVEIRPITGDDFAKNYKAVDRSGIPEKKLEILETLPDVDIDALVREVPEVLFWSAGQLRAKLDILAEAMPGQDLNRMLTDCPDLLSSADYLKDALVTLARLFPGKTLPELLPKYPEGNLGDTPRPFVYPKNLEWEVPYLDPGLMGNYSVEAGLIQAMKDSQHLVFGLWREDMDALKDFVAATKRATLAFETRVQFLREFYGEEQFSRYYANDLFGETMGHVGDWVKKHPGYEGYMSEKLDGFQNLEGYMVRRMPPYDKEELMVKARREGFFDQRDRAMLLLERGGEEEEDGWDAVEEEAGGGDEEEEGDDFEEAMMQALWVFDVRSGFLEKYHGPEKYHTEVSRRAKRETAGTAKEFSERYPQYVVHLETELDGWGGIDLETWQRVDIDTKEDAFVEAMMIRARALVAHQKAMAEHEEPDLPPILLEQATESREEYIDQLDEAELQRLEGLSEEEIKRHFQAYEAYLHKRFPSMFKVDGLGEPPADYADDEEDDEEAGTDFGGGNGW